MNEIQNKMEQININEVEEKKMIDEDDNDNHDHNDIIFLDKIETCEESIKRLIDNFHNDNRLILCVSHREAMRSNFMDNEETISKAKEYIKPNYCATYKYQWKEYYDPNTGFKKYGICFIGKSHDVPS